MGKPIMTRELEISVLPLISEKKREAGSWVQSPTANDLMTHVMNLPLEPKRTGFVELLAWWTHGDLGRVGAEREHGSSTSFPYNLYASLPSGCSELYPFIINK